MAERADSGVIGPDREALLGVLARHGVAFVLIGGAAIQSHGLRYDTPDMDVTPDTTPENLAALADALNELECRLITDPADAGGGFRFPPTTSPSAAFAPPASGTSRPDTASSISASRPPASRTATPIWSHAPGNERSLKRLSWRQSLPLMMSTSPSVRPIDPRTASTFKAQWSVAHEAHGDQKGEQAESPRSQALFAVTA